MIIVIIISFITQIVERGAQAREIPSFHVVRGSAAATITAECRLLYCRMQNKNYREKKKEKLFVSTEQNPFSIHFDFVFCEKHAMAIRTCAGRSTLYTVGRLISLSL